MFPSPVSLLWEASAFYVFIIIWSMPICSCQLDIPFILSVQNQRVGWQFQKCVRPTSRVRDRALQEHSRSLSSASYTDPTYRTA